MNRFVMEPYRLLFICNNEKKEIRVSDINNLEYLESSRLLTRMDTGIKEEQMISELLENFMNGGKLIRYQGGILLPNYPTFFEMIVREDGVTALISLTREYENIYLSLLKKIIEDIKEYIISLVKTYQFLNVSFFKQEKYLAVNYTMSVLNIILPLENLLIESEILEALNEYYSVVLENQKVYLDNKIIDEVSQEDLLKLKIYMKNIELSKKE